MIFDDTPDISVAEYERRRQQRLDDLAAEAVIRDVEKYRARNQPKKHTPKWNCIPVVDDNAGITYPSSKAASVALGVCPSAIASAIKVGGLCVGHRLHRVGVPYITRTKSCFRVPILDLATGRIYPNSKAAAQALGTSNNNVSKALYANRPCRGHLLKRMERTDFQMARGGVIEAA